MSNKKKCLACGAPTTDECRVAELQAFDPFVGVTPQKRTIRLLAVTSPVAGTDRSPEQTEFVYAVASDETFWIGEWTLGKLRWSQLPSLPQDEPPAAA